MTLLKHMYGFQLEANLFLILFFAICYICDLKHMISVLPFSFFFPCFLLSLPERKNDIYLPVLVWGPLLIYKENLADSMCSVHSFSSSFLTARSTYLAQEERKYLFSLSITKRVDESISAEIELCVYMWHRVEHFINFYHCSARDLG